MRLHSQHIGHLMARASKRDEIIKQAEALFLNNGFKGTSVDLVVNTCGVSKPTVYKHFPDKEVLMDAVMDQWLGRHRADIPEELPLVGAREYCERHWWNRTIIRMYALVFTEGWRFPAAARRFIDEYDQPWRGLMSNRPEAERASAALWELLRQHALELTAE